MAASHRIRTRHAELSPEEIAGALPGTGEVMAATSHAFAMAVHAARGGNWELSAYYVRRTRSLLRGLQVTRPKYAARLADFESRCLEPLLRATGARDPAAAGALFTAAAEAANRHHDETGHPYIRWTPPPEPPELGLDLSPGA